MEKTKRQLRAEAVERLKEVGTGYDVPWYIALFGITEDDPKWDRISEGEMQRMLIDLLTDEPTNGIDGETNGIADDATLDDPVEIMRECGGMEHGMGSMRKALGIECVSGWQMRCLKTLADMVERDYVRRQDFEAQHRTLCAVREQRDEWKASAESNGHGWAKANVGWAEANAEAEIWRQKFDEWKIKCETREVAYKQADAERKRYGEQIDELIAERDQWREVAGNAHDMWEKAMTERDKLRGSLDTAKKLIEQYKADCVEYIRQTDKLEAETIEYDKALDAMKSERDELERKLETLLCTLTNGKWSKSSYTVDEMVSMVRDEQEQELNEAIAEERDEWKAKAEAKSAKRAAAVERIKNRAAYENWMAVILGIDERSSEWKNIRADEASQRLIDLLTDDDGLRSIDGVAAEHATNLEWLWENDRDAIVDGMTCDRMCTDGCGMDKYGLCGLIEICEGTYREWLMAPHEDAQRDGDVTPSKPIGQFNAPKSSENAGNSTSKGDIRDFDADTREKLEADFSAALREIYNKGFAFRKVAPSERDAEIRSGKARMYNYNLMDYLVLLDRQAAITRSECFSECDKCAEDTRHRITELQARVDELTANHPISQSDAPKSEETAETDAAKCEIRDLDDTREKLEAAMRDLLRRVAESSFAWDDPQEAAECYDADAMKILDRQAAITELECRKPNWYYCDTCEELSRMKKVIKKQADSFAKMERKLAEKEGGR